MAAWHNGTCIFIHTLEGTHRADCGDWIIKGVKGEFYPCKPDVFEATYEPAEDEGDYETHYQTAIVYKEMGLMEEAIREFQDAVNLSRADDGTRRFFQCCNLLGLCFMESNMPNLALMWYRRAMETPNLREEEKQALLYEIGIAYEMGGEKPKALEYFEQIYAVDVDYRDVSSRLESLREGSLAMR